MQVRFQGRLEVERQVDEEALDLLVPALVFQPLVENAIRHGLERRSEGGKLAVEAAVEGGTLVLRVRDNGADRGTGQTDGFGTAEPAERRVGVGVSNTKARLERLYGADQHFTLSPLPEGGMLAEVRLPVRHEGAVDVG
jgi:two-component system LytT family sensor kinase